MKYFRFYLLICAFSLINCSNDDNNIINPLDDTELLDEWEIIALGINNVSSLEAVCCETLKFSDDGNNSDMRGYYIFDDASGVTTNGVFIVDNDNNVILYTTENNSSYTQEYFLESDVLEVWHFEDGNRHWTQYMRL